jgi:hypothetical protein
MKTNQWIGTGTVEKKEKPKTLSPEFTPPRLVFGIMCLYGSGIDASNLRMVNYE